MNARERRMAKQDPAALAREAEYQDEQRRRAKERKRSRPRRSPGKTQAERRAEADAQELDGKARAMKRSEHPDGAPRCEVVDREGRCVFTATAAHHALCGRWKSDVEALPNGEGYIATCDTHHTGLFHGAERLASLEEAREHGLRIGSWRLVQLVDLAIVRYRMRHGRAA